jgi:hypothetical protein
MLGTHTHLVMWMHTVIVGLFCGGTNYSRDLLVLQVLEAWMELPGPPTAAIPDVNTFCRNCFVLGIIRIQVLRDE